MSEAISGNGGEDAPDFAALIRATCLCPPLRLLTGMLVDYALLIHATGEGHKAMNQVTSSDRGVSLLKFVLDLLKSRPDGLRPRDVYKEIEAKIPLDQFDTEIMSGSGLPRWRASLHFQSVAATKAGILAKSDGWWRVTDEGIKAAALSTDELKRLLRSRYREWRWGNQKSSRGAEVSAGPEDVAPGPNTSVLFEDAKEKARTEIDEYLDTLSGYEFQDLVAALLEGMGYATNSVSAPGADGGTDVLA